MEKDMFTFIGQRSSSILDLLPSKACFLYCWIVLVRSFRIENESVCTTRHLLADESPLRLYET